MPLIGVPKSISPELLYILAKLGHGDQICIADANFPSDSIANSCITKTPIRVNGSTASILRDILKLMPVDQYNPRKICLMDQEASDALKGLKVVAYDELTSVLGLNRSASIDVEYLERQSFYFEAKKSYFIIQTNDSLPYANCIISKGVVS